jgi:hypothetical protein
MYIYIGGIAIREPAVSVNPANFLFNWVQPPPPHSGRNILLQFAWRVVWEVPAYWLDHDFLILHCKKRLSIFPSRDITSQKLSLAGNN